MFQHEPWSAQIGMGVLLGLGWVLVAFNTFRAIQSDASAFSRAVGVAVPLALALVLFVGAIGIVHSGLLDRALQIAGWTVLGTVSVVVAAVLNIVLFEELQPDFLLALFMIVNAAAGGAAFGFFVGLYDAQQGRLRAQWKQESMRATALSQRLSVINRVLRHDIRNQTQVMMGFPDRWEPETRDETRLLDRLKRASDRLAELSNDAYEMQSLLEGETLGQEPVEVVSLAREVGDTVERDYPSLTVDYDLPDQQRVAASPLLDQALRQLLTNAAEHNDADQPRAIVSLSDADETAEAVQLSIADNGPGIPDDEPILDAGFIESQLEHSTGVGLWFTKWIIEDSDGAITFESDPEADLGTVVTITLPAA